MSLYVFISSKDNLVRIVRWIGCGPGEYPAGPVVEVASEQFFLRGDTILRDLLVQLRALRSSSVSDVRVRDVIPVFEDRKSKRILRDQRALWIVEDPRGVFRFIPMAFEKASIVGFRALPSETERSIAFEAPSEEFWKQFHEALSYAE